MDKVLWTIALLVMVGLSGCLAEPQGAVDESEHSGLGDDDCPVAERKGVVFFNEPFQAAPGNEFSIDVDVPDCNFDVDVELSATPGVNPSGLTIRLTGCGEFVRDGSNSGLQIGVLFTQNGDLCDFAESGTQTLTVSVPIAPMSGNILLRADLPKE